MTKYNLPEESKKITFDGSLLKTANLPIEELQTNLQFTIKIKNNLDEEFVCTVKLENIVGDDTIYNGYYMKDYAPDTTLSDFLAL